MCRFSLATYMGRYNLLIRSLSRGVLLKLRAIAHYKRPDLLAVPRLFLLAVGNNGSNLICLGCDGTPFVGFNLSDVILSW